MPRSSKGARLWLRPARGDRAEIWVILDRGRETSTGCSKGDLAGAEQALAQYVAQKHDPKAARQGDPNKVRVADALVVYYQDRVLRDNLPRPKAIKKRLDDLNEFFGAYHVGQLNGDLQRQYADQRGSSSAARRDLGDLAAAINFYNKDRVGGVNLMFHAVLPDAPDPRDVWLTRDQAAHLIRTAWRARRRNRDGSDGPAMSKHLARFILIGLYTGTRASAICGASLMPAVGRGYVDLDRGVFHRKAIGARTTNKRQPTVDLPPRLLAHMRRWHRLGISKSAVIEYQGQPVQRINKAFSALCKLAGLPDVSPHTLRHTSISWYLRAGVAISDVSDYCGVSETIIRRHYKHHMPGTFNRVFQAAPRFGKTGKAGK
jgi:integrase